MCGYMCLVKHSLSKKVTQSTSLQLSSNHSLFLSYENQPMPMVRSFLYFPLLSMSQYVNYTSSLALDFTWFCTYARMPSFVPICDSMGWLGRFDLLMLYDVVSIDLHVWRISYAIHCSLLDAAVSFLLGGQNCESSNKESLHIKQREFKFNPTNIKRKNFKPQVLQSWEQVDRQRYFSPAPATKLANEQSEVNHPSTEKNTISDLSQCLDFEGYMQ